MVSWLKLLKYAAVMEFRAKVRGGDDARAHLLEISLQRLKRARLQAELVKRVLLAVSHAIMIGDAVNV